MNAIIELIVKFSGLGALWDKVDGYKTNIGAAGLMVGGIGMMCAGAAAIIAAFVGCIDHACQIELVRGLSHNDNVALALKGFLAFKGGLMGLGIGHKLEKAAEAAAP